MTFPKTIDMTRYLKESRQATQEKRVVVAHLRNRLHEVEEKIKHFDNYQVRKFRVKISIKIPLIFSFPFPSLSPSDFPRILQLAPKQFANNPFCCWNLRTLFILLFLHTINQVRKNGLKKSSVKNLGGE